MTDQPRPPSADEPPAGPDPSADGPTVGPDPSADELARIAVPATIRRAPRYRAWVLVGGVIGVLIGLVAALAAGDDGGAGAVLMVLVLGAVVGALGGGVAALAAERTRRS